jgi:hypothetical protein
VWPLDPTDIWVWRFGYPSGERKWHQQVSAKVDLVHSLLTSSSIHSLHWLHLEPTRQ